jgi:hypothetical protein
MKTTTIRWVSLALIVLGLVAALIGAGFMGSSTVPRNKAYVFSLPNQANRYVRITVGLLASGIINISFQADSSIRVYVMTEAQHTEFLQTGNLNALDSGGGTSGLMSTAVPTGGTYYVEIGHGPGYETTAQSGSLRLHVDGTDPTLFLLGLATFTGGLITLVVGVRSRWVAKKRTLAISPPPAPTWMGAGPPVPPPGAWVAAVSAPQTGPSPPASSAGPAVGVPAPGTILLTVENRTGADETVQILAEGSEVASLTVPAGTTQHVSVALRAPPAAELPSSLEIVTREGRRWRQDLVVGPGATATAAIRLE